MALGVWQATIQDNAGNILPGAQVTVRRESAGSPLAVLYADRDGTTPLGNPFTATTGFARFFVAGFAYRIDIEADSFSQTHRYVPVGTAAEGDAVNLDVSYLFNSDTADSDPGSGQVKFDNAALASVTTIYFNNLDELGADLTAWLDRLDDYGSTSDRGVVHVRTVDGSAEILGQVTGTVVDGTGYRKVSVTVLASAGAFTAGGRVAVTAGLNGADGADGGMTGPGATTVAGQISVFSDASGNSLEGGVTPEGSPTEPMTFGTDEQLRQAIPGTVMNNGQLRTANETVALSDAATIAFDWTSGYNFQVTLGGNRTLANPTNAIVGQWKSIAVIQDGTGSRTLGFGDAYQFPSGTAPTLTTTAGAKDRLVIYCHAEGEFEVFSALDVRVPA